MSATKGSRSSSENRTGWQSPFRRSSASIIGRFRARSSIAHATERALALHSRLAARLASPAVELFDFGAPGIDSSASGSGEAAHAVGLRTSGGATQSEPASTALRVASLRIGKGPSGLRARQYGAGEQVVSHRLVTSVPSQPRREAARLAEPVHSSVSGPSLQPNSPAVVPELEAPNGGVRTAASTAQAFQARPVVPLHTSGLPATMQPPSVPTVYLSGPLAKAHPPLVPPVYSSGPLATAQPPEVSRAGPTSFVDLVEHLSVPTQAQGLRIQPVASPHEAHQTWTTAPENARPTPVVPPGPDIEALADRVSRVLRRRDRDERERNGLA